METRERLNSHSGDFGWSPHLKCVRSCKSIDVRMGALVMIRFFCSSVAVFRLEEHTSYIRRTGDDQVISCLYWRAKDTPFLCLINDIFSNKMPAFCGVNNVSISHCTSTQRGDDYFAYYKNLDSQKKINFRCICRKLSTRSRYIAYVVRLLVLVNVPLHRPRPSSWLLSFRYSNSTQRTRNNEETISIFKRKIYNWNTSFSIWFCCRNASHASAPLRLSPTQRLHRKSIRCCRGSEWGQWRLRTYHNNNHSISHSWALDIYINTSALELAFRLSMTSK